MLQPMQTCTGRAFLAATLLKQLCRLVTVPICHARDLPDLVGMVGMTDLGFCQTSHVPAPRPEAAREVLFPMRKEWSSFPGGLVLAQSCRRYDTIMSPHWCQAACTTPHDLIPQWLRTIL